METNQQSQLWQDYLAIVYHVPLGVTSNIGVDVGIITQVVEELFVEVSTRFIINKIESRKARTPDGSTGKLSALEVIMIRFMVKHITKFLIHTFPIVFL